MVPIGEAERKGEEEKWSVEDRATVRRRIKGTERRENVEVRGVDLHWLDLTSVKLRSKRGGAHPSCGRSPCRHYLKTPVSSRPRPVQANRHVTCKRTLP